MNNTSNHLTSILVACMLFAFPAFSQKVDTVTYKGQQCFVYPYKLDVRHTDYYFRSINLKKHDEALLNYMEEYAWKGLKSVDEYYYYEEYDQFKQRVKDFKYNRIFKRKQHNPKLKNAIRLNPYPLLEQRYSRDEDIEPCLDPIPDGTYIQYFNPFPFVDTEDNFMIVKDRVAGIFTIKNNVLEGKAYWFNFKGDTLKSGTFEKGLKVGEWVFERRETLGMLSKEEKEQYVKNGAPDTYIQVVIYNYKKGVLDGYHQERDNTSDFPIYEGYYTENEVSGHWKERSMSISENLYLEEEVKAAEANLIHNKVITADYTLAKSEKIVKQPIIRNGLLYERYAKDYNFEYDFRPTSPNRNLFSIAFTKEVDLELEEEKVNSYEGSEYDEEYYGDEYYGEVSDYDGEYYEEEYYGEEYENEVYSPYRAIVFDRKQDKYLTRGKAIDSLGVIFNYEGVYERRYPNGQLMFRYEFKDGKLLKEDTIFWDNGKPFDVVTFVPDSNQYMQTIYDYDGKVFNEIVYDSLGDYKRINFKPIDKKYVNLGGLMAEDDDSSPYYTYDKMDTVKFKLEADSVLIWKSWYKKDSSDLYQRVYYPQDRVLKMQSYSITGKNPFYQELTFSEDFKSWTGFSNYTFDDLTLKSNYSAAYSKFKFFYKAKADTIPQLNVNQYNEAYDITADEILYLKDIPYSGPVSISFTNRKASFNTNSGIELDFPISKNYSNKLRKAMFRYKRTGKARHPEYLNALDRSDLQTDHSNYIFFELFPFLDRKIQFPEISGRYYDYGDNHRTKRKRAKLNEKNYNPWAKTITGSYKNGKPDGIWTVTDQFGNVQMILPFSNGELNGTVKSFNDAEPIPKNDEFYYYEVQSDILRDSFPAKKTHYLEWVDTYKNGMKNGESIHYNWLGETELYQKYVDGYKQGKAYERSKLAYTRLNYLDDELDGYMQTYLTLPGRDSMLLFDLNFQNGELQGESKSYHLNGKLSKRGFFLNGLPIDDYEAYDSLGFRYHYVKFQYSFPIEEKIWEENELSVLYTFDWRDSIFFTPSDITKSQSLDRMLYNLGIGLEDYNRPYYGRPSLVEKTGIDYHMTKFYPNDTIARDGELSSGKKIGCWKYYSYEGELLYEVEYFDSLIKINDSIQFKSKGLLTDFDAKGQVLSKSYIIEKFEKYDCSHTDHYEIRQLYTVWEAHDSLKRINGYVKNHYDNGVLQNEGNMVNGLPSGVWKYYDPFGKLNQVGVYVQGKRDGRWLAGDLSKTKYLGDICLNPNLPNLEEEIKMREQQLDIIITNYKLGKAQNKEFYDINWGQFDEKKKSEEVEEE